MADEYRSIDGALRVSIAPMDDGEYLVSTSLSGIQVRAMSLPEHETASAWARTEVRRYNERHGHGYIFDEAETVVGGRVVKRTE